MKYTKDVARSASVLGIPPCVALLQAFQAPRHPPDPPGLLCGWEGCPMDFITQVPLLCGLSQWEGPLERRGWPQREAEVFLPLVALVSVLSLRG